MLFSLIFYILMLMYVLHLLKDIEGKSLFTFVTYIIFFVFVRFFSPFLR